MTSKTYTQEDKKKDNDKITKQLKQKRLECLALHCSDDDGINKIDLLCKVYDKAVKDALDALSDLFKRNHNL